MIDAETEHLISRAKKQAVLAIQAEHPAAERAHQLLAIRYSAKAVIGLMGEEEAPGDEPGRGHRPLPLPDNKADA